MASRERGREVRPSPEAVALAKAIPDTSDALWKWSIKMDNSVSLESDPTPVHAAIRILAAECDALEKERDEVTCLVKKFEREVNDGFSRYTTSEHQSGDKAVSDVAYIFRLHRERCKERDEWMQKAAQYAADCEALEQERDDAIAEATNAVNDIIRVRYQRDALLEALEVMASQHKCGCGHPHCNRCADDRMCEEAIAAVKGAQE